MEHFFSARIEDVICAVASKLCPNNLYKKYSDILETTRVTATQHSAFWK